MNDRLKILERRARFSLWIERLWPALWQPAGVMIGFVAVSWLGLWLETPPALRMAGILLFAAGIIAACLPLFKPKKPSQDEILRRLDQAPHGPVRTLNDTLTLGRDDEGSRILWERHRRQAAERIETMRVGAARIDMARRDPYALRALALIALAAGAIVAGDEKRERLASAFDWRWTPVAATAFRLDGWIDPPLYTRLPPIMLDLKQETQSLRAPLGSTIVIRASNIDPVLSVRDGLKALPASSTSLSVNRFVLEGDATLIVAARRAKTILKLDVIPDRPPSIALVKPPEINARGSFNLVYEASDDYGIAKARGEVQGSFPKSLVPAPVFPLPLAQTGETKAAIDLGEHPWAGVKVSLTLIATDEAGQEGRSNAVDFVLPQRVFTHPLAKALVEQRRLLVLLQERRKVQLALDALLVAPERFTPQPGLYLSLRLAGQRLRKAKDDAGLIEVADLFWSIATGLEDGHLSEAERDLRAAQERLREALKRGADAQELQKLSQDLRQAVDRFLSEMARPGDRSPQKADTQAPTLTPNDFARMLDRLEEAMRNGETAEAQKMLEALRDILENLQTAQQGQGQGSGEQARELGKTLQDLDRMTRDQQSLRDDTFGQGQDQHLNEHGDWDSGEPKSGAKPGRGSDLKGRQEVLRERLRDLQKRLPGGNDPGLAEAESAMRDAEGALGKDRKNPAADAQGRALQGLQQGLQNLAGQMREMLGETGQGKPGDREAASQKDDPLGRPLRGRMDSGSRVRIPEAGEAGLQRARQILDDLRRRLGETIRPREELDYLERLLKRN